MIGILLSPQSTWRPPVAPSKPPEPPPGLDPAGLKLFNALLRHGRCGSLVWPLLNEVAAEEQPQSRTEARQIRLELWKVLRALIRKRVIFRYYRKSVSIYNLPRATVNRRRRSRAGSTVELMGSKATAEKCKPTVPTSKSKGFEGFDASQLQQPTLEKTQSAQAAPSSQNASGLIGATPDARVGSLQRETTEEMIQWAASSLAKLPRKRKRWTGYADGVRLWRNQKIILPFGEVVFCYGCLRNKLVWTSHPTPTDADDFESGIIDAHRIRIAKDSNAVILGRRKAGVKERKSAVKAAAARLNGVKPCRPGRRRGRPKRKLIE